VRAETLAAADAILVAAQAQVPITQLWGGGLLASVDGLRFVVPVRTINAGPSPKYFGQRRGLTRLNAVNDQVSVVPGTPRDSLHILDVLVNLDAGPKPDLIATDEASYSDVIFGIFAILGYRFSPRIADIGDTRYWRATWPGDPESDYGPLGAVARNKVNLAKIVAALPDMLRVAGSLVIDCHTKACIGYAIAEHMRAELVIDALHMAARNYALADGAIFHSDRGTQCTCEASAEATADLGIRRSVGRTGSCYDNAQAESFNAALKVERVNRTVYPTREHVRKN